VGHGYCDAGAADYEEDVGESVERLGVPVWSFDQNTELLGVQQAVRFQA